MKLSESFTRFILQRCNLGNIPSWNLHVRLDRSDVENFRISLSDMVDSSDISHFQDLLNALFSYY